MSINQGLGKVVKTKPRLTGRSIIPIRNFILVDNDEVYDEYVDKYVKTPENTFLTGFATYYSTGNVNVNINEFLELFMLDNGCRNPVDEIFERCLDNGTITFDVSPIGNRKYIIEKIDRPKFEMMFPDSNQPNDGEECMVYIERLLEFTKGLINHLGQLLACGNFILTDMYDWNEIIYIISRGMAEDLAGNYFIGPELETKHELISHDIGGNLMNLIDHGWSTFDEGIFIHSLTN